MTITRLVKLPPTVKAFTLKDEDGNYNIYINRNIARGCALRAYSHEIEHILAGDLDGPPVASVGVLEGVRHHENT